MITEKDEEIWRAEIARHVRHLSRAVHEITFWMAEVEKTGLLPEGLSRRALSRSQLQRLDHRIKSVQDALESVMPSPVGQQDALRDQLEKSLALLQDKADALRESLSDA
tara:strand:- start:3511 stop:3837 length:327 start_codon:yes stop_codon:yes gene_type:complete